MDVINCFCSHLYLDVLGADEDEELENFDFPKLSIWHNKVAALTIFGPIDPVSTHKASSR